MRPLKLILSCLILVAITSCSGSKKTTAKHYIKKPRTQQTQTKPLVENETDVPAVELPTTMTSEQRMSYYINTFQALAQEEMERYGIPASITLAQGILESGAGNGALALKAQNHFGIKCHSTWSGDRVYHDDDEKGECFRKYTDAKYSYRDHSLFLTQRSRYSDLFDLDQDDYKSWARGLKKAGYATDPSTRISLSISLNVLNYGVMMTKFWVKIQNAPCPKKFCRSMSFKSAIPYIVLPSNLALPWISS